MEAQQSLVKMENFRKFIKSKINQFLIFGKIFRQL